MEYLALVREAYHKTFGLLPSYPFPRDPEKARIVWDLAATGDVVVVCELGGYRIIVL